MRLLSRYLLRELAAPFFFALGALTSMLLLNQIAKRFPDLVGKGLTADIISEVLLLSLPFIIALTLPMAVLVAVLYGFSHLAADNELTAMRAGGISVFQMLRPVFLVGVAVAVTNFLFIDQVLPRSNARLRNLQMDIARKKPTFTMQEQGINPVPPTQYFIRASRIEPISGRMRDVTIYDLSLATARRIVYADSGMMAFEASGEDMRVLLRHGVVHEYRYDEPGTVRVTNYTSNVIRARDVANALERSGTRSSSDRRQHLRDDRPADAACGGPPRPRPARALRPNDLRAMLRVAGTAASRLSSAAIALWRGSSGGTVHLPGAVRLRRWCERHRIPRRAPWCPGQPLPRWPSPVPARCRRCGKPSTSWCATPTGSPSRSTRSSPSASPASISS
jgi:lipopolysaccharide export LptBFGC system permease protein LptF